MTHSVKCIPLQILFVLCSLVLWFPLAVCIHWDEVNLTIKLPLDVNIFTKGYKINQFKIRHLNGDRRQQHIGVWLFQSSSFTASRVLLSCSRLHFQQRLIHSESVFNQKSSFISLAIKLCGITTRPINQSGWNIDWYQVSADTSVFMSAGLKLGSR